MTARLLSILLTAVILYALWWAITDGVEAWCALPGWMRSILGTLVVGGAAVAASGFVAWLVVGVQR